MVLNSRFRGHREFREIKTTAKLNALTVIALNLYLISQENLSFLLQVMPRSQMMINIVSDGCELKKGTLFVMIQRSGVLYNRCALCCFFSSFLLEIG